MLKNITFTLIAFLLIVSNQSCKTFAGANPLNTVWAGVANDRQFSILAELLKSTGWAEKLNGKE